jgi:hypothetical protein
MSGTENTTEALTGIIELLKPLNSEERHRTVNAAMLFLGETAGAGFSRGKSASAAAGDAEDVDEGDYSETIVAWMKKNGVSAEELERVFHFNDDRSFDIHEVPGKYKSVMTLNAYTLTGLGNYLMTNERMFNDDLARGFCEKLVCYDAANHALTLRKKHPEFSGDKAKGYTLTNVGIKRGAALVKEVAGAAK